MSGRQGRFGDSCCPAHSMSRGVLGKQWHPDPGPETAQGRYGPHESLRGYYDDPVNGNVDPAGGDPSRKLYRMHTMEDQAHDPIPATPAGARKFVKDVLWHGAGGAKTRELGSHWHHNPDDLHAEDWQHVPSRDQQVMLEAAHPGHEHVMTNWDHPEDGKTLERHVGWRDANNVPEVAVRPGAPMELHAIHFIDNKGWPPKHVRVPVPKHGFGTHA